MGKDVHVKVVPQFKGLSVEDMIDWGRLHTRLEDYLPEFDYKHPLNREWIANICK